MVECKLIPFCKPCFSKCSVLIDTWWNVNQPYCFKPYFSCSFNRYMVECKYVLQAIFDTGGSVLIDTWWNVNIIPQPHFAFWNEVLIDTWWNVNCLTPPSFCVPL